MSAVIVSDVRPFKEAGRQPPPKNQRQRADEIMASIQGADHQALAKLLDYRVSELEEKVEENGRQAQGVAVAVAEVSIKIDTLIDLHQSTTARLDAHIDRGDAPAAPMPTPLALRLTPAWVLSGAAAVAAWAAAAFVAGKAHTDRFVAWFLNIIGA